MVAGGSYRPSGGGHSYTPPSRRSTGGYSPGARGGYTYTPRRGLISRTVVLSGVEARRGGYSTVYGTLVGTPMGEATYWATRGMSRSMRGATIGAIEKSYREPETLSAHERELIEPHLSKMPKEFQRKYHQAGIKIKLKKLKEDIQPKRKDVARKVPTKVADVPGITTSLMYGATPETAKAIQLGLSKAPIVLAGERLGIEAVKFKRWATGEVSAPQKAITAMEPSYTATGERYTERIATHEAKWEPHIKDDAFIGKPYKYREYLKEFGDIKREGAQLETQHETFGQLEVSAEREERERFWGLEAPYKRKAEKASEWVKVRTPETKQILDVADTPKMKESITKTYGTYRGLFGLPSEPFEIEKKMGHVSSQYKIGMYESFREEPYKMVATTAVFAALPPVLKGAKHVAKAARVAPAVKYVKPLEVTWKKGIPKIKQIPKLKRGAPVKVGVERGILPSSARHIPKGLEYGMGAAYAGVIGHEVYVTPPSERAYKLGRITATELAPMYAGIKIGVGVTTAKAPASMKRVTKGMKESVYEFSQEMKTLREVKRRPTPYTKEDVAAVESYLTERATATGKARAERFIGKKGTQYPSETIFTSGISRGEIEFGVIPTPTRGRLPRMDRPVEIPPEMMVSGLRKGEAHRIYGVKRGKPVEWETRWESGIVGTPPRSELGLMEEQMVSGMPSGRRIKAEDPQLRRTMLELKYPETYGAPPGYVAGKEKLIRVGRGDPTRITYVEGKGVEFGKLEEPIRRIRKGPSERTTIRERDKDILRMFEYPEIYGPLPSVTGIKRVPKRGDVTRIPKEGDPLRIGKVEVTKMGREYKKQWAKERKATEKDIKEGKVTAREEGGLITLQKVEVVPQIVKEKVKIKAKPKVKRQEFEEFMQDYRTKTRERERAEVIERPRGKEVRRQKQKYAQLSETVIIAPREYKEREKKKEDERERVGMIHISRGERKEITRFEYDQGVKGREREKERVGFVPQERFEHVPSYKPIQIVVLKPKEGLKYEPVEVQKPKLKEKIKLIEREREITKLKKVPKLKIKEPPPFIFGLELPEPTPRKKIRAKKKPYAWKVKNPIPELQQMFTQEVQKRGPKLL